jgi:hypothetical protein
MATGRQATTQLTAANIATLTTIYTVPTGYYGIYNKSFTNTAATSVTIRLALATTTSPSASEYIEYLTTITGYGVFERTGVAVGSTQNIIASTSGSAVNVNVYGIETSTS